MIQITEILGRADQGMTRPFLCSGHDGALYYAKGKSAGRKSLVAEWIGSSLAQAFGLPVAQFEIGEVDAALIRYGNPELTDLGEGHVFLSRRVENVMELAWSNIPAVPAAIRADLLVFDFWIRNQDRTLTAIGGNPNLLWNAATREIVVIDHNQALDTDFDHEAFLACHVFAENWNAIVGDMLERQRYEDKLRDALDRFNAICDKMPESWWWLDTDLPLDFSRHDAQAMLSEPLHDFWSHR